MRPAADGRAGGVVLAATLALVSALGCGAEFDPPSEVKSLRVLGVQKSRPYADPGEEVDLNLLWHDGSPEAGRAIQTGFIGDCVNPPGDLYYGCFAQFAEKLQAGQTLQAAPGDSFKVTLPRDIISGRGGPREPGQARYGLYIVFFIACAGQVDFVTDIDPSSTGLPVRCLDANDEPLGSEDFVVGYSSIYSFEGAQNTNPVLGETFRVAGKDVPADCRGIDCQSAPDVELDCSQDASRCLKSCAKDGDSACPAVEIEPQLDPSTVELDDVSSKLFNSRVTEQMWVNYYVDRGGISDVRLLNDTTSGWNEEFRAQLRAPKAAGALKVWAVVHDNRGGMDIARVTLNVE